MKITKARNVTYLGRAAKVWTVQKNTVRLGERVDLTRWVEQASAENGSHPAGTVSARHMHGDGRFPAEFSLYAHALFTGPTAEADAQAWAVERIESGAADSPESQAHAEEHRRLSLLAASQFRHHRSEPVDCTPPSGC